MTAVRWPRCAGDTGDPATLATQITKLKQRFRLDHVVLVGDRAVAVVATAMLGKPTQANRPFIKR